jgi:Predicted P-loop ATPase
MWLDAETDRDFINFESVADTIAEMIIRAKGKPISIGVSGDWGVGKSSMIKLAKASLKKKQSNSNSDDKKYLFVDFNAWLYQGYDDARAALLEVIANQLASEAEEQKTALKEVQEFLKRIKWVRAFKIFLPLTLSLMTGTPLTGLFADMAKMGKDITSNSLNEDGIKNIDTTVSKASSEFSSLWGAKQESSPPKEIQQLRDSFESALKKLNVVLVVLIDDLDRCLPDTTISTLEAIRLFLFLENTAFVIAADDNMIKHAVKKHFGGLEDDALVTNYFDKLIQVPIRVPALGTQEVRAYMMMLFIENSELTAEHKDNLRMAILTRLQNSWKGERMDKRYITEYARKCGMILESSLVMQLDIAERLARLMTVSKQIAGNPRLIKRFLNALSIRTTISLAQGVDVDEAVLAKLLLFERLAPESIYMELVSSVNSDPDGKSQILVDLEKNINDESYGKAWKESYVQEWFQLDPPLSDKDLRGALYVSRERFPLITAKEKLSSQAHESLHALLEFPKQADTLTEALQNIAEIELEIIMEKILANMRQEHKWGIPPILTAAIVIANINEDQAVRLVEFLKNRLPDQIEPSIVPMIANSKWSGDVFDYWNSIEGISKKVKSAIADIRGQK